MSSYETPGVYRTGPEIYRFFVSAGIEVPGFEGTRKWWVLEQLEKINYIKTEDKLIPNKIWQIMKQLLDPGEFYNDFDKLREVLDYLNDILLTENLWVFFDEDIPGYNIMEAPGDYGHYIHERIYASDLKSDKTKLDSEHLHPLIKSAAEKLFSDSHFSQAVFEAFKALNNFIQKKSGRPDLDGCKLMTAVFNKNNPILKANDLKTQTDKDEQEGLMHLYMGSVLAIRNPRAHETELTDTRGRAINYLLFASLLADIVDELKK